MTSSPQPWPHHPNQASKKAEKLNAIHNTDLEHQRQVLSYGKDEDTLNCIFGLESKTAKR